MVEYVAALNSLTTFKLVDASAHVTIALTSTFFGEVKYSCTVKCASSNATPSAETPPNTIQVSNKACVKKIEQNTITRQFPRTIAIVVIEDTINKTLVKPRLARSAIFAFVEIVSSYSFAISFAYATSSRISCNASLDDTNTPSSMLCCKLASMDGYVSISNFTMISLTESAASVNSSVSTFPHEKTMKHPIAPRSAKHTITVFVCLSAARVYGNGLNTRSHEEQHKEKTHWTDFKTIATTIIENNKNAIASPGNACPIKTFSYVSSFLKYNLVSISPVFAFNRGNEYSVFVGNARIKSSLKLVVVAFTKEDWIPVENEEARV